MDDLRCLAHVPANARGRQQIKTIERGMMEIIFVAGRTAKRTGLHADVIAMREQLTHVYTDELGWAHADEVSKGAVYAHHAMLVVMKHDEVCERVEYLCPLFACLSDLREQT